MDIRDSQSNRFSVNSCWNENLILGLGSFAWLWDDSVLIPCWICNCSHCSDRSWPFLLLDFLYAWRLLRVQFKRNLDTQTPPRCERVPWLVSRRKVQETQQNPASSHLTQHRWLVRPGEWWLLVAPVFPLSTVAPYTREPYKSTKFTSIVVCLRETISNCRTHLTGMTTSNSSLLLPNVCL